MAKRKGKSVADLVDQERGIKMQAHRNRDLMGNAFSDPTLQDRADKAREVRQRYVQNARKTKKYQKAYQAAYDKYRNDYQMSDFNAQIFARSEANKVQISRRAYMTGNEG